MSILKLVCLGCLLSLVLWPGLMSCDKDKVVHELAGRVEGTVVDSLTRLPIDCAWISASPDTSESPVMAYTDSSGIYIFMSFAGRHRLHYCGKNGYVTKESPEYEVQNAKTTIVDFELVPLKQ